MTDLQNFTNTGINPAGINDQLAGFIVHNTTYYITVICRNNALLETMIVDELGKNILYSSMREGQSSGLEV